MPDSPLFFLGRKFDLAAGQSLPDPVLYDPADLTTHALVTGMTGSGKTGLCIAILEEAALHGIPAVIIDIKGDLTNLLLHFPDLKPADFEPWLDPDSARRAGQGLAQLAEQTAARWQKGLAEWGLGREQLLALRDAVDFNIFTPGSTAGTPVNTLASLSAPGMEWQGNEEVLREKINSTVTALLSLVGVDDIDPLRSREHILLSNLLEQAWKNNRPFDLTELILQVQNPPFDRLGAFPINNFFPEKDRQALAVLLNNFLAAPSFQTWMEGQPLDVAALLYAPDGKPRHSIFYLAHLADRERMFFVTLLFAAIESWMRAQRGTSGLRALVYFDEIHGYLPPVQNPPSRPVLLRLLKTARAFGLGLLLATQNPVDVDYKALSNAGTWIIGRLQTEQDKQRLLDGLESAAAGALDRSEYDRLISALRQRVFLLHNVHQSGPQLFQTRWALNFLAGPLTRAQIPELLKLAPGHIPPAVQGGAAGMLAPAVAPASDPSDTQPVRLVRAPVQEASLTRPAVPAGVGEFFLPNTITVGQAVERAGLPASGEMVPEGIVYRPVLFAQAEIHVSARRYQIDARTRKTALVGDPGRGRLAWENYLRAPVDPDSLESTPLPGARFLALPAWLADARRLAALQKDFGEWVYRNGAERIRANESLKLYGGPQTTMAQFRELCAQTARRKLEEELDQLDAEYNARLDTLENRIDRQKLEVESADDEVGQRRWEEVSSAGELVFGLFSRRRRSLSYTLMKRRLTQQAKDDLVQERRELEQLEAQLEALQQERDNAAASLQEKWAQAAADVTEMPLSPQKKDIFVELFGAAWLPCYLIRTGDQVHELPAFE